MRETCMISPGAPHSIQLFSVSQRCPVKGILCNERKNCKLCAMIFRKIALWVHGKHRFCPSAAFSAKADTKSGGGPVIPDFLRSFCLFVCPVLSGYHDPQDFLIRGPHPVPRKPADTGYGGLHTLPDDPFPAPESPAASTADAILAAQLGLAPSQMAPERMARLLTTVFSITPRSAP